MRTNATLETQQAGASQTSYLPLQWRHAVCGQVTSVDGAQFTDSLADFTTAGVEAGWTLRNRTDNTTATVVTVDSATAITLSAAIMAADEYYTLNNAWARFDNLTDTDRLLGVEYSEEPYGSSAAFVLQNADSAYDAYDLRGKQIRLGLGMLCGEANEVSYLPVLFGNSQAFVSAPNQDIYKVYAIGAWSKLMGFAAARPTLNGYHYNQVALDPTLDGMTARDIIAHILSLCGLYLATDYGTIDSIDTAEPVWDFWNGTSAAENIYHLMSAFQSVLIPYEDGMRLRLCSDLDSADYTYETPSGVTYHPVLKGQAASTLAVPAKATAIRLLDTSVDYTAAPNVYGSYAHADWTPDMGHHLLYEGVDFPAGIATTSGDCEDIAEAAVRRAASQTETGSIFLPVYNCLQELYDLVTVDDNRGNTSGSGRVGGIFFHYPPVANRLPGGGIEKHTMELRLGGMVRNVATDMPSLVDQMQIELLNRGGLDGRLLKRASIPAEAFRQTMQAHIVNLVWSSSAYNKVGWATPSGEDSIVFEDGTVHTLEDSASEHELTEAVEYAYFMEGNDEVQWTEYSYEAHGPGKALLAICSMGDSVKDSSAYIRNVKGKKDIVNATAVITDVLSAIVADLGLCQAGEIRLGSGTVGSDFTGIRVYKDGTTYRVAGLNNDTAQAYIDSDGKFKGGSGRVVIDSTAMHVYGHSTLFPIKFYDTSDALAGYVYCVDLGSYSVFGLASNVAGAVLYLGALGGIHLGGDITPTANDSYDLGSSSMYFKEFHAAHAEFHRTDGPAIYTSGNKQADIGTSTNAFRDVHCDQVVEHTPSLRAKSYLPMLAKIKTDKDGKIKGGKDFPLQEDGPLTSGIGSKALHELLIGTVKELSAELADVKANLAALLKVLSA